MITFFLMNFIVGISVFLFTYRILKFTRFIDSLLAFFILYFAQIVFTELLLGIFNILYLENVILFNLAIFLIIWLITRNKKSYFSLKGLGDKLTIFLSNKVVLFGTSLILGFGLAKICINLINPPFGWDCLNYHYTFPVEWIKHANLDNPIVVSDDPFPSYYPINGSLLFLWLIFPFKSAFLADIGQLPFFIISFLAIVSIGRKLKLKREYSLLAAYLFVFIPNFFKQLQIGYTDIMVAGIFFATLNFLMELKENFTIKNNFIFSLSFGILIGLKTTVLAYAILLLLPFLYIIFVYKKVNFRFRFKSLLLFLLLLVSFGSFSYLKNFILTGNPLYPLDIVILGKNIFKGVIDKYTFNARNEPQGYSLIKLLFHEGMGVQSLFIILPGAMLAPFINILKNKNRALFINYILFLPILLYLSYRFIMPIPNSRYLYPILGTGMVAAFYIINSLKLPIKIMRSIVFIFILASAFENARHMELIAALFLSIIIHYFFINYFKSEKLRIIFKSKFFITVILIFFVFILNWLSLVYKNNEYRLYIKNSPYWPDATLAWDWLNRNTKGNNIAYVGRPLPYPLYGTNLKNNVYYVSVNAIDPIHLHDLKNSKYRWDSAENMHKSFEKDNNYRSKADYYTWFGNLKKRKTDYLFIYSNHHTKNIEFPLEDLWARTNPKALKLIFGNDTIRIYKIS